MFDPKKTIKQTLEEHHNRLTSLENIADDIRDIGDTLAKLLRHIKIATPSIVSAAIAAGIINGKFAEFLRALLTGS